MKDECLKICRKQGLTVKEFATKDTRCLYVFDKAGSNWDRICAGAIAWGDLYMTLYNRLRNDFKN